MKNTSRDNIATQAGQVKDMLTNARDALKDGDQALAAWFFAKAQQYQSEYFLYWQKHYSKK